VLLRACGVHKQGSQSGQWSKLMPSPGVGFPTLPSWSACCRRAVSAAHPALYAAHAAAGSRVGRPTLAAWEGEEEARGGRGSTTSGRGEE